MIENVWPRSAGQVSLRVLGRVPSPAGEGCSEGRLIYVNDLTHSSIPACINSTAAAKHAQKCPTILRDSDDDPTALHSIDSTLGLERSGGGSESQRRV